MDPQPLFTEERFDVLELYAGRARITRIARASGYLALAADKNYDPSQNSALHLNTSSGFAQLGSNVIEQYMIDRASNLSCIHYIRGLRWRSACVALLKERLLFWAWNAPRLCQSTRERTEGMLSIPGVISWLHRWLPRTSPHRGTSGSGMQLQVYHDVDIMPVLRKVCTIIGPPGLLQ